MRPNRRAPLSHAAIRRLPPIPAKSSRPDLPVPLMTFLLASSPEGAPSVATELRPLGKSRSGGWQLTVSARGAQRRVAEPPRFEINRLRSPRGARAVSTRAPVTVTDAHRPSWIPFEPAPRRARRIIEATVTHRGTRLIPLVIKGKDDRRLYNDTSYPWGCVCRVVSAGRVGSGVLIGPRHVLTASHVINWDAGWAVVEVFRFDATFAAGSCCTRYSAFTKIDDVDSSTVDEDYAVLTLVDRLGDQFGWMGSRRYHSEWDEETWWRTIGYPQDLAGGLRPSYEEDFDLDEDPLDLGEARAMTCGADLMKGHSGGAIFGFWPDGVPYVVAVVSAAGSDDNNYCAGGPWLPELVQHARDLDP